MRDSALMGFAGWKSLRTRQYRYIAEASGKESLFDLDASFGEYLNAPCHARGPTDRKTLPLGKTAQQRMEGVFDHANNGMPI